MKVPSAEEQGLHTPAGDNYVKLEWDPCAVCEHLVYGRSTFSQYGTADDSIHDNVFFIIS